jgi:hypothetical protein
LGIGNTVQRIGRGKGKGEGRDEVDEGDETDESEERGWIYRTSFPGSLLVRFVCIEGSLGPW